MCTISHHNNNHTYYNIFVSPNSARTGVLFLSFRSCMSPLYLNDGNRDIHEGKWSDFLSCTVSQMHIYRIAGKFGGLVVSLCNCQIKIRQYFILAYMYVWRSLTEPPNLNPPIFLQWWFGPIYQLYSIHTRSYIHVCIHTILYLGLCLCSARYILTHRWMITAWSALYSIFLATVVQRYSCITKACSRIHVGR